MDYWWFRAIVWSDRFYEEGSSGAKSLETKYTTTDQGPIRSARNRLRDFAIPHYQRVFLRRYGYPPNRSEIKVKFEAEERAHSPSRMIIVDGLEVTMRGRQHYATPLPRRYIMK